MISNHYFVFDIDGTLHMNGELLPGTTHLFSLLRTHNIPFVLLTNTTSLSTAHMQKMLEDAGLSVDISHIITPIRNAVDLFTCRQYRRIAIYRCSAIESEFTDFIITEDHPDAVLLADDGNGLAYDDITGILQHSFTGIPLYTLQQNKFYARDGKMVADLGFYVAGLRYITGQNIVNCGKPSQEIFELARKVLQAPSLQHMIMVGDDLEFDVLGAQKLGITGILLKTGKYQKGIENNFSETADYALSSLFELADLITSEKQISRR